MAQYDNTTLVIKHLPPELDVLDRKDFLQHLGACYVKCIASQVKKSSVTFARFPSKEKCRAALRSLHQREILGSLLSVEYAKGIHTDFNDAVDGGVQSSGIRSEVVDTTSQRKVVEAYRKKLNSWTNCADFSQPPPPHLRYLYPPPSEYVLRNICKVLARVPKFYTQVLHLMNKMNLPCPFSETFRIESDLVSDTFLEPVKIEDPERKSDSESELESDDEWSPARDVVPKKRVNPFRVKKPAKIPKIVEHRPAAKPSVKPEEVFETTRVHMPKKIELKVSADLNALLEAPKLPEATDGFGVLEARVAEPHGDDNGKEEQKEKVVTGVISTEELEMNRIPPKDFHLLPVFKNYQPGLPTYRLYIKNLSKTVTCADLEFIFNRYRLEEKSEQINLFDIRLMQEGRMKGQAFVSLQSVELAEKAVEETNGYILKGKAMVVQFARSNKPK